MPLNRVHNVKAMLHWLLLLNQNDSENDDAKVDQFSAKLVSYPSVPKYCPGFMLIPMPEAGPFFGYVDIGFWAAFLYVLGSLFYFIDSFLLWQVFYPEYNDDPANPAVYFNTMAASVFVLNAVVCILDWWVQLKQMGAMNLIIDEKKKGGLLLSEIPRPISVYYFYNNFFFLGAATVYLIQSIWWEDPSTDLLNCSVGFCGLFWIEFWGSFLYFVSSYFSILEFRAYSRQREREHLPPLKFFSFVTKDVDWFGWGDVLFLATSVVAVVQVLVTGLINDDDNLFCGLYMLENVLFLVDSVMYFIGYILYMLELENSMRTGMFDAEQTATLGLLMEKIENDDFDINIIDGHPGESADNTENEGEDTQQQQGQHLERQTTMTPFEYLANTFSSAFTEPLISSSQSNDDNNNNIDEPGEMPSLSPARPTTYTRTSRSFSVNSEGKISLSEIRERLSEALAARAVRRSEQSLLSDEDMRYSSMQGPGPGGINMDAIAEER